MNLILLLMSWLWYKPKPCQSLVCCHHLSCVWLMAWLSSDVPVRCESMSSSIISSARVVNLFWTFDLRNIFFVSLRTPCCLYHFSVSPLFLCGYSSFKVCLLLWWFASGLSLWIFHCSQIRLVGCTLAGLAAWKRGEASWTHAYFRVDIQSAPIFLLRLPAASSGLLSWCLWVLVCDFYWILLTGSHVGSSRRAWKFAGVGDSVLRIDPCSCKSGILAFCCSAVSCPVSVLVCIHVVWLCRSRWHESCVCILLLCDLP